jgi:hypothetical protein
VIYDHKNGALYSDDGEFLKSVHCPLALQAKDLVALADGSPDRHCPSCEATIRCADGMTDEDMKAAVSADPHMCIFATRAAKHITVLKPIGHEEPNVAGLPIIRTARSFWRMQQAFAQGFRLVLKAAGPSGGGRSEKYTIWQNSVTSEIWWSGDYRGSQPYAKGDMREWELVADWFWHGPDWPFPFAAYLVPPDLKAGDSVYLEDLIEDVTIIAWNQGNGPRLLSSVATWNGADFELAPRENDFPSFVG